MKIGDRVKHSESAIRPKRDYWLSLGDYSRKQKAKEWLDSFTAERGTVVELLKGNPKIGSLDGLRIQWDNGSESRCLPFMVTLAED